MNSFHNNKYEVSNNDIKCMGPHVKFYPDCLRVKDRVVRVPPGYQSELVIQLLWVDGEPPPQITSVDINSAYGL